MNTRPLYPAGSLPAQLISLILVWILFCQTLTPRNLYARTPRRESEAAVQTSRGETLQSSVIGRDSEAGVVGLVGLSVTEASVSGAVDRASALTLLEDRARLVIFGPRRFDRTNGPPNNYVEHFDLPAAVTSPFTLRIQNGEADGSSRVSSATIKLNDAEILAPKDLNQNVASVDRSVSLNSSNTLEVRLTSKPGSYLIINIEGLAPITDTTAPALTIASPADNFITTASAIDFSGTASDSGTGIAHVYVNGLEAVFDVTSSSWSLASVPLLLGANQIIVRAVDVAGNETLVTLHVTRIAPNHAPNVDAGVDQAIALPHSVNLHGAISDDGLPSGSSLSIAWSVISGPGEVIFSSPNSADTTASFSVPGSYLIRLSASDGEISNSDEVNIKVDPENHAPTAEAGLDQTVILPREALLNGSASDDGLPSGAVLATNWSVVSGPGPVTFANPAVTVTGAIFSEPGSYVLKLTVSDSELSASDELTVKVIPENHAPIANAGVDQTITLPNTLTLNGSASDDGLPQSSVLSVTWTKISGPGDVVFTNANVANTSASFTEPGAYLLRLTVSDSELVSADDVSVTVIPQNYPPTAKAGVDQNISYPNSVTLNGSVSDDGLPAGTTLNSNWSQVSGPGVTTFDNPSVTVTTASFSQPGTYLLRLTANDSELSASDEVTIIVTDPRIAPVADFIVPESTGAVGAFVIASSGSSSSSFGPENILDNNTATFWTTATVANQFVKLQLFDQENVFIDRIRLQGPAGTPGPTTVKDFDVQVSATNSADSSLHTVLSATYLNNGQLQEFMLPGGPARARFIKFIPRTNYGSGNSIQIATFNPVSIGNADGLITLRGQNNAALAGSPALIANGAAVYRSTYPGGSASANGLLGYNNGGWFPALATNPYAIIELAGSRSYLLDGVKLATAFDSGFGATTAVKTFEVWVSSTTPDDSSFTRVLTATAAFNPRLQTFMFPGGPVAARYVKYVPLTNGGGLTVNTQSFDVIAQGVGRVVAASGENQNQFNSPECAFDTDDNSIWYSPNAITSNVWVKTSLGNEETQKIYGVRINPVNDFTNGQRGPKDFDIRVSTTTTDDAAFTTVFSGTLQATFNGGPQEFLFPALIDAKYVQFFWKNAYTSSNVGVRTLEVLAARSAGSAIIGVSSQESPASNSLDLDPSNQWVTALNQPALQWMKVLLPRGDLWTIHHLQLRPAIATNGNFSAPKDFELQISTTDAADAAFVTVLSGTLSNSTELQDFYFTPVQARYVRLLLKSNYGGGRRYGLAGFYLFSANQVGSTTRFIDRSTDADDSTVAWSWDFGDGSFSNEQHPSHTFPAPGTYVVTLTVTDQSGLTNTRQATYQVVPSAQVDFAFSPVITHEGGESVRFTDTTQLLSDQNTARRYDFGDGVTLTQSTNVSFHQFTDSGTFPVTLRVGNPLGIDYSATKNVVVLNMTPTVDIAEGKTVVWGEQWTSVPSINDQSPVDRLSLQGRWDFGDGQTSICVNCTNTNATVTRAYARPGIYTAVLTITDKDGASASDNAVYSVNKRPVSLAFQQTETPQLGQPLTLRVRLMDSFANQPLTGRTISFGLNADSASSVTDANGFAEVAIPFAAGLGANVATAQFAEEEYFVGGSTYRVLNGPTNQQTCKRSSSGTDFWLMFPGNDRTQPRGEQQGIFLDISSEVSTTGTVSILDQNITRPFSVAAHTTTRVRVDSEQYLSDQIENRGIHVVAQQPVTIYGLSNISFSVDAYLALPTASLGNNYVVLGYNNGGNIKGTQFGIVASAANTLVSITPRVSVGTRAAGVPFSITLNQGQTFMLRDEAGSATDLSGTLIQSDKPIAVFGGHECANIPAPTPYCDYVVEQLPPSDTWGTHFATLPLATRAKGDTFRFLAATDNTHVFLNGAGIGQLNRGQYLERIIDGPSEIVSDLPILVAQYSNSHQFDGLVGDPFMMLVPPLEHYLNAYTVNSLSGFGTNRINLVVPSSAVGQVTLDGVVIPTASFAPIRATDFAGAQLTVAVGTHNLSGPHPFGVHVYGFNEDVSYGYPGSTCLSSELGPVTLTLQPKSQTATVGGVSCVNATLVDLGNTPIRNQTISFAVSGAHPQTPVDRVTDALGRAQFCYSAASVGDDLINAINGTASDVAGIGWRLPNQPPAVNAGADQTVTLPAAVNLSGSVNDDGLPLNTLSWLWSKVAGPGEVTFGNASSLSTTATFSVAGVYILRLQATDTSLTGADEVQITVNAAPVNQPPTANAGTDQVTTINGNLIVNGGSEQPLTEGEISGWSEVEGSTWTRQPGGADGPQPQRGNAYFYAGSVDHAELRQDVDLTAFAPAISQGTQQFEFKAYLRSLAESAPDSGRVVVEFRDAANTNVIASLDSGPIASTGEWHLTEDVRVAPVGTRWIRVRLIATRNLAASGSNDAYFDSISLRPLSSAGIKLSGVVTDDGLPFGSNLIAHWSVVSGPGSVEFVTPNLPVTGAFFTTAGNYVLRLSCTDGAATASDDVAVTVLPANQQPVVSAGINQTITLPAAASLLGTASDDGQPPGAVLAINWSKVSGPGTVSFANAGSANTTTTFSVAGNYILRLTADDSEYSSAADLSVLVNAAFNHPPTVNAGSSQTISLPVDQVSLNGSVTDDGLPAGMTLNISWTKISGPGAVVFANPSDANTSAHFSSPGTYLLRLTANDGEYAVFADVSVVVTPANQSPSVNAGEDQTILLSQQAQLNGTVVDDGLPLNGSLLASWSKVSGPGVVNFANSGATNTSATFSATGVYVIRLTARQSTDCERRRRHHSPRKCRSTYGCDHESGRWRRPHRTNDDLRFSQQRLMGFGIQS